MSKSVRKQGWILAVGLGLCTTQAASIYTFNSGFADNGDIPDNNATGWVDSRTITMESGLTIRSISVTLNIGGGWNGDLVGYLRHETTGGGAAYVALLNRVGTISGGGLGYSNPGFGPDSAANPFRLSDSGTYSVHTYQDNFPVYNASGQLTGTWRAEESLASFKGMDPSGTWSLYLSDRNGGDISTVQSWGLELSVPEPQTYAMVAGFGLLGFAVLRRQAKK